jgi:hypothetical protein
MRYRHPRSAEREIDSRDGIARIFTHLPCWKTPDNPAGAAAAAQLHLRRENPQS